MKSEKKTKQLEFKKIHDWLKVNGNYYRWESDDGKPILKREDNEKVEKQINRAKEIAKKMKDGLDAEAVLVESILHLKETDIDKLYNLINSKKRKYKPRTREGHCVDMKVGRFILPIVD